MKLNPEYKNNWLIDIMIMHGTAPRKQPFLARIQMTLKYLAGLPLLAALCLFLIVSCTSDESSSLQIGDQAPDFTLQDLNGQVVQLADYAGSPVILRFFLTDCKFCRADTPVFNEYYDRYKEKGLGMLYIDTLGIERATLKHFADEFGITFPVVQDMGGGIGSKYKVRALPQTIVLDPDHKIIAAILGGVSEPELNTLLLPYF